MAELMVIDRAISLFSEVPEAASTKRPLLRPDETYQ